jgi:hypothetical protein
MTGVPRLVAAGLTLGLVFVGVRGTSSEAAGPSSVSSVIDRIVRAYPSTTKADGSSLLVNGKAVVVDDGVNGGTFDERMNRADVVDQLSQAYPAGCPLRPPAEGADPGRLRSAPFFLAMYGASSSEVRKKLVSVPWFGSTQQVTTVNGVDSKLRAVANELAKNTDWKKYLTPSGGSFNWRTIAGTKLLSTHSFGIAVDINVAYSDYWRWKNTKQVVPYKNRIPCEIAEVFERHGFIWGAKWWHFDTMHFEYRPELLP